MRTSPLAALSADPKPMFDFRSRLERVQHRDTAALGAIYIEHGNLVYQTAFRLTGNRADAEDITQDVFLRLPAAVAGFTGLEANFAGWIRRVGVRAALMHLRATKRRREVDVDGISHLLSKPDGTAERMTIDAALQQLDSSLKTVFVLKEVEGYEHSEIAELLGISAANSEVRLHRARKQLREMLRGSR